MINSKKLLLGGLDSDTAPQLMDDDSYLNLQNGRVVNANEQGRGLRIQNVLGTIALPDNVTPPYGLNFPIGSATDKIRGRILRFVYNTFGDHGIYCFDKQSGITYAVIYDSQVIGGLGFTKEFRINRNTNVVGNYLYWTDNNNEPRRINIESGIKINQSSYVTDQPPYDVPMNQWVLTVVRDPPAYPLTFSKLFDSSVIQNNIALNAFQFRWGYIYKGYEESKLSPFSKSVLPNPDDDDSNVIEVTAPFSEIIDQDVQIVELTVTYLPFGKTFVIKEWNKDVQVERDQIRAHNLGLTNLTYTFKNDRVGRPVDDTRSAIPYDSVPIKALTQEVAINRYDLGNFVRGYNTPTTTSLSLSLTETNIDDDITTHVWLVHAFAEKLSDPGIDTWYYSGYYVFLTSANPAGWYLIDGGFEDETTTGGDFPTLGAPPADTTLGTTYVGASAIEIRARLTLLKPPGYKAVEIEDIIDTMIDIDVLGDGISFAPFLGDSPYQCGIIFYDKAMRRCGVITNDGKIILIPDRAYTLTTVGTTIQWALSNGDAVNEIPDWAWYYQIVRSLNRRTRHFVEEISYDNFYAAKNVDGEYVYVTPVYDQTTQYGLALNMQQLIGAGLGYTFTQGDFVKIWLSTSSNTYTLPVLFVDGDWLVVKLVDLGDLSGLDIVFQVYTPFLPSTNEPFYEIGELFPITNPGLPNRTYSTLTGTLNGDISLVERDFLFYQAMSPTDKVWNQWVTDAGVANFITRLGQKRYPYSIVYSEVLIEGTQVNGLSTFDPLNQKDLPMSAGAIQQLKVVSNVQEQGSIMLSVCANEAISLYMGQTQVIDNSGNSILATSPDYIGTVYVLKGGQGTQNPESLIERNGLAFWVNASKGTVVQYSNNGLDIVSDYKMIRFWQNYLAAYLASDTNNLDNINGFHHIGTCIDPFTNELLITLPALIYENYANILPSYSSVPSYATSIINRFDVYDMLGKTMSFDIGGNKWRQNYEYLPEWMDYFETSLYGYKNNCTLYQFNSDSVNWNRWFGVDYPVRLCQSWNVKEAPSAIKDVYNTALESNAAPNFTVLYGTYPWIQITDLTDTDYSNPEGVFYADFLRDRLTPAGGTPDQALYTGNIVKENCPMVMFEVQAYTSLFYITFTNLGFQISKGTQSLIGGK